MRMDHLVHFVSVAWLEGPCKGSFWVLHTEAAEPKELLVPGVDDFGGVNGSLGIFSSQGKLQLLVVYNLLWSSALQGAVDSFIVAIHGFLQICCPIWVLVSDNSPEHGLLQSLDGSIERSQAIDVLGVFDDVEDVLFFEELQEGPCEFGA